METSVALSLVIRSPNVSRAVSARVALAIDADLTSTRSHKPIDTNDLWIWFAGEPLVASACSLSYPISQSSLNGT